MKTTLLSILLGLAFISSTASSHHAASLLYDTSIEVSVEGIVSRFELGNPHMRIYFTRSGGDESSSEWMAEGGSRTVLIRRGWTADMLKSGDRVVLHGHASRDERPIFHVVRLEMPDGSDIGAEDSSSTTILDDIRKRRSADRL